MSEEGGITINMCLFRITIIITCIVILHGSSHAQWRIQKSNSTNYFWSVDFLDQNTGWVTAIDSALMYKTTDGGVSWIRIPTPEPFCKIQFFSQNVGYALGYVSIFKSTDGGMHWTIVYTIRYPSNPPKIFFVDENTGWVSKGYGPYNTTDGGINWTRQFEGYIQNMFFLNKNVGWFISDRVVYSTVDGGNHWMKANIPNCREIYFLNETIGWALSDYDLLKTTDGGTSWVKVGDANSFIFNLKFINEKTGFFQLDRLIGTTRDSGKTWTLIRRDMYPPTPTMPYLNFYDYDAVDENHLWAVGENGIIAQYDSTQRVTILSPNGGDSVYSEWEFLITWYHSNLYDSKGKIEYSTDNGVSWNLVVDTVNIADCKYLWMVPALSPSDQGLVRMTVYSTDCSDVSDTCFHFLTESRKLTMVYPAGGEFFRANQGITFRWDANYSTASNIIIEFIPPQYYYQWEAPLSDKSVTQNLPYTQNQYKIKIHDKDNPHIMDVTGYFWIKSPPSLSISSPNGNETFLIDSIKTIEFMSTNNEAIKLEYSINAGATWNIITNSVQADSNDEWKVIDYEWTVPNTPSTQCRIRASSIQYPNVFDISDNNFEIAYQPAYIEFPLRAGNKWFYKSHFGRYPSGYAPDGYDSITSYIYYIVITGSQVLKDDGYFYFPFNVYVFDENTPQPYSYTYLRTKYFRRSSNSLFLYGDGAPYIDFNMVPAGIKLIFDKQRKLFWHGNEYAWDLVADSIGITELDSYNQTVRSGNYATNFLVGAVINDIIFGDTLDIDLVSIHNAPEMKVPTTYRLSQNYPNPCNPTTTIEYSIPKSVHVTLKIYDMLGRHIQTLADEQKYAGNYTITFNGSTLASGVYIYRFQAGSFSESKKLLLLR
jgi:photosystem II stability/assembly factor-like uncharacterized protein